MTRRDLAAGAPQPAADDIVDRRVRSLIEHAPYGALEFEAAADGRLVFRGCNPAAERFVARPLLQFVGHAMERIFPGLAGEDLPEGMRRVAVDGGAREWRNYRYDDIHGTGRFDLHVAQVGARRVVLMFRDVTDASEALLTVRASEAKFSQAFHVNPDPMIITRLLDGVILDANRAFESFSGYPRYRLLGQPVLRFGIWCDAGDRNAFLARLRAQGNVRDYAARQKVANGQLRDVMISASLFNVGPDTCLMTVVRDVTLARRLDESLRQSEAKFGAAFRGSVDAMAIARLEDGCIEEVNEVYESMFGITRDEAIGRNGAELGIFADISERDRFLAALRTTGSVRDYPLLLKRRNGEVFEAQSTTYPVSIQGVDSIVSVVRDVSEAHRRERELRESEGRFAAAFRASPDAISITLLPDGQVVDVNDAYCGLLARHRDDLVGHTTLDFGFWDDPPQRASYLQVLERDGRVRDFEARVRRSDGSVRSCVINSAIAEIGGERCVLSVVQDVTEQQRTAEALRTSRQFLELVLDSIPVGVFWKDRDHVYRGANRVFAEDAGVASPDDLEGLTDADLPWRAYANDYMHHDDDVILSGRPKLGYEDLEEVPGRAPKWQLKNKVPLRGADGAILGVLGTTVDITEKRHIEDALRELNATLERRVQERTRDLERSNAELETALGTLARTQKELFQAEKMAALGALVAGVSHELNTPIGNGLMVASTLEPRIAELQRLLATGLTRSALDSFLRDIGEANTILLRNLQRAAELISGFKQVAADRSSSQRRRFPLRETVGEIVITLTPTIRRRGIRIEQDVVADTEMDSYPGALGQVLTNLVTNAVVHAFGDRQEGLVRVTARELGQESVEITVADNGRGIPPEHLHRVFEPFFTTRLGSGGSGLGLSIVHNLVTAVLGGRIEVDSTVGAGTSVILVLPRVAPAAPKADDTAI